MTVARAADDEARVGHPRRAHLWTIAAFIVGPLAGALVAWWLGHNDSWDLRNYHWYNAYALIEGRMGFDVAVAHHATYYNPLLDVPVWCLGHALSAMGVALVLGAVHGLNLPLLFLIARASLAVAEPRRSSLAFVLAVVGSIGAYAISLTGSTHHDNVVSLAVLFVAWQLVRSREVLAAGAWRDAWPALIGSGIVIGAAVGLKLPTAPFGVAFLVALLAIAAPARRRAALFTVGGAAAFAGLLLTAGWWCWRLWQETGNPVFPYFNDVIGSPLVLDASYRDSRFLPRDVFAAVFYPFRAALDWRVSSDWPVTDWRIAGAYVAALSWFALSLTRQRASDPLVPTPVARVLFVFAAGAYVSWLAVFAIYRYIVPLEMLAPLLIVAGIGAWPLARRTRVVAITVLLVAAVVATSIALPPRRPFGERVVEVTVPPFARPDRTLVLMTGVEPMAFVIPSFPAEIPFLRIDGWLVGPHPPRAPMLDAMMKRIDEHIAAGGDVFVLFEAAERERSRDALAALGLVQGDDCVAVPTNLTDTLRWCPVDAEAAR